MDFPSKKNLILILFIFIGIVAGIFFFLPSFFEKPSVHIDSISNHQTFTTTTIKFNIYNSGHSAVQNVGAHITIYDKNKNSIAADDVYIGTINNGETKPVSFEFQKNFENAAYFEVLPMIIEHMADGQMKYTFL